MIYEPYPFQQYCTRRIIDDNAIGLFLDMGLGKTSITLSAIQDLRYNRWAVRRVLIIAPKKVAESTWQKEAAKWEHTRHIRFSSVMGTERQRIRALVSPADIYIINRELTEWIVDYYKNDWNFDMVVLDESSSFKSQKSKRWKALKRVRKRIERIVLLTGTPASNGLDDLWAQVYLLDEGQRLYDSKEKFHVRFFDPDQRSRTQIWNYKPREGSMEAIQAAISDICVSMKAEDYISMPDIIYQEIPVTLNEKAAKQYKKLERELLLEHEDGVITAGTAGILTGKLLQLCNGAVYDTEKNAVEIHKCKIEAFIETVEQLEGAHVLVFYNFQHDRNRLCAALEKSGLRVKVYEGSADETAWNNGEIDILLAHPASCAYGLNLQNGGHHVIWFGLTWSLEQYEQANKRLHRQGQKEPVIVHHLVTQGGTDEDVMEALQRKGDMQSSLMEALKARIEKARLEE